MTDPAKFDPLGTIELVDHDDPRLDREAMDVEKYKLTYNPALIKDKDASKPATRYLMKPIDFNFFNRHMTGQPSSQLMDLCVRAGLVAVKLPDGSVKTPTTTTGEFGQPVATKEWFTTLCKRGGYDGMMRVVNGVLYLTKLPEDLLPTSPSYPG